MANGTIGRSLETLARHVVKETVRSVKEGLPSGRQVTRIEEKLRGLERRVSRLARSARGAGRPGRPRVNPETCTVRGCKSPARARALCSRHYQQKRRRRTRKK